MAGKMFMRVHKTGADAIVAVCDAELIGKKLREGKTVLDLDAYGAFYKGAEADEKAVLAAARGATSINAVGKQSVAAVRKAVKCEDSEVRFLAKVPHLQVYKV